MLKNSVVILGIGNVLFSDEGFGIHITDILKNRYDFSDNVSIVDGGVLGINLLGVISEADKLIVLDVIRNNGNPGDIYKLRGDSIPERIRDKNSLHQIDFLESLTLCKALGKTPETLIIGIEPKDITTLNIELTNTIFGRMNDVINEVLNELKQMGLHYDEKIDKKTESSVWKFDSVYTDKF